MHHIKTTNADVAIGHFELANFEFHQGQVSNHGLDASVLKRFKKVLSGHYHHRSTKDNITYLGTPYEMTWADYNDPKGFHVLDTETLDLEFIENHHKLFIRLEYADDKDLPDTSNIDGKFVKVIVQSKTDYYRFDQFVSSISGSSDLKIIESVNDLVFDDEILDNSINLEDTSTILMRYIDSIQTDIDKDDLKMFMRDLYIESLNAEDNYSC
jgi:DNA repair exonuclease SbcCD nuclease subunit